MEGCHVQSAAELCIIVSMKKPDRINRLATIVFCFILFLMSACAKSQKTEPVSGEMSDMSGYLNFADQDAHIFYDMTVQDMAQAMDEGKSFVVYFGYDTCEWCLDAVPVINDAAKETGWTVGYVNTRAKPSWNKNTDIDDYDLLVEKVGSYLEFDAQGIRHLYAPTLFFIKNGQVAAMHEGTLEGHNAKLVAMTAEEREELKGILVEKFSVLNE